MGTQLLMKGVRYQHLDQQKKRIQDAKANNPKQNFEESLKERIAAFGGEEELNWIYGNDIEAVWENFIRNQNQ